MSHAASYASGFMSGVDREMLKLAIDCVVALELEGHRAVCESSIRSYDEGVVRKWNGHPLFAAIRTDDLPQGLGVYFRDDGVPEFVVDKLWEAETVTHLNRLDRRFAPLEKRSAEAFNRLTEEIQAQYMQLAVAKVCAEQYDTVDTVESRAVCGGAIYRAEREKR